MVGWHHQLDGHEFEQTLGVGDGQEGLACCDSQGHRVGHKRATELTEMPLGMLCSLCKSNNYSVSTLRLRLEMVMQI